MTAPPVWDEKNKEFSTWLREAKAWKCATSKVTGLKDVHGLQLALHMPERSEIRQQLFDSLETEEMAGEDGWIAVIKILEDHYQKDDNSSAFETWKEFRALSRQQNQSIDEYIMLYEKYKLRMKRYKMDLGERIHGLNLLCGANLADDELRIAMREVNSDQPDEIYEQAKRSLKKYFGKSSITSGLASKACKLIPAKEEPQYTLTVEEYDSYAAWKRNRNEPWRHQESGKEFKTRRSWEDTTQDNRRSTFGWKNGTNPTGADGRRLQCRICSSTYHFARKCPEKMSNREDRSHPSYLAMKDVIECDASDVHARYALNHMILDTGCPQNVAGKMWADCFIESLDDRMTTKVKQMSSNSKFKFGGGRILQSLYCLEVPILIAGEETKLTFDVVDSELPLLLGKETMKIWNVTIRTGNDSAQFTIDGKTKEVALFTSASGHWCVNIQPCIPVDAMSVLFSVDGLSKGEKQQAAARLHRQYCHPPFSFLKKVLSVFNEVDDEFLEILQKYSSDCCVCKKYKPTSPKPAVGNLMDPDKMKFNQIVSMDLKQWKDRWIIYMIDVVTRYTRASFINNKKKETIIAKVIELWLAIFGAPNTFLMDNGGEFANDDMRELGNQFGINIKHTAAYAPWANGLNERNHATIDVMIEKMLEETPEVDEDMILQYAVSIRNCCMYVRGFTPAQLAIGQNPKLPSTFHDDLPALEGVTTSSVIAEHLNTIATARKAFVQAEISAKLRKALKHPVRPYADIIYKQGDQCFYKLPNERRWQGPATVVGVDGKVILIKHGSVLRRVHPCNLQLLTKTGDTIGNSAENTPCEPSQGKEVEELNNHGNLEDSTSEEILDVPEEELETEVPQTDVAAINEKIPIPKRSQDVKYRYTDGEWKHVTVLGPAGSRKGKYKNWVNVADGDEEWSMDWSDVKEWQEYEPKESNTYFGFDGKACDEQFVAFKEQNEGEFLKEKLVELEKWKAFDVYHEVPDNGQRRVTGRWVCTRKITENGLQPKARYVVRGFQEKSTIQSDSPTGSKDCMRIILAVISSKHWCLKSIDIKAAFLQGNRLERDIYIEPPSEAHSKNKLWKLDKCVYGLNDAARMWYFTVWEELESLGCRRSVFDYGVFTWLDQNQKLAGVFQSHVDDFLWSGTNEFNELVIQPLCQKFKVGNQSETSFKYVGINIAQRDDGIILDQLDYIQNIEPISLTRDRHLQKEDPCTNKEATMYRQLVGKLNWIANQSRPDIFFDVCQLSSLMKTPEVGNLMKANKILSKVKETPLCTKFPDLGNLEKLKIICYSDASLGNLSSGKSVGGHVIFLLGENGSVCPVSWKTRVLRRVVRSTISAETSAMIDALDNAYFLSRMVSEILQVRSVPIMAYTDNESMCRNVHSTTMAEERRLRIDLAIIKQMLHNKELSDLQWIPSKDQLADCLTKQGSNPIYLMRTLEIGKIVSRKVEKAKCD